jgi:hypothetical protein
MQIDPTTKFGTEHFECQCHSDEHTLRFTLDTEPALDEAPEIYTSVFLGLWEPWWKRIWIGIKYVFGYTSKYGHFDCWTMKPEDVDRMLEMLHKFKDLERKHKNRVDKQRESK